MAMVGDQFLPMLAAEVIWLAFQFGKNAVYRKDLWYTNIIKVVERIHLKNATFTS